MAENASPPGILYSRAMIFSMAKGCLKPEGCATPILWPPDAKTRMTGKDPEAGKRRRGRENEMVGWHQRLNGVSLSKLWEIVEDRGA